MDVTVKSNIDFTKLIRTCKSDDLWFWGAKEWHRLTRDYVPKRDGNLNRLVTLKPKQIIYRSPYSAYIYYGKKMVDPVYKKGGFTSDGIIFWSRKGVKKIKTNENLKIANGYSRWDVKAIEEKKDDLLVKSMEKFINKKMGE